MKPCCKTLIFLLVAGLCVVGRASAQQWFMSFHYHWPDSKMIRENKVKKVKVKIYAGDTTDLIHEYVLEFDRKGNVVRDQGAFSEDLDLNRCFSYDETGRLIGVVVYNNEKRVSEDSVFFDEKRNRMGIYRFDMTWRYEEYVLDTEGKLTAYTKYGSDERDPGAKLNSVVWKKEISRTVLLNKSGKVEKISDADYTATYTYDAKGRLLKEDYHVFSEGVRESETYVYRKDGLPFKSLSGDQEFPFTTLYFYEFFEPK